MREILLSDAAVVSALLLSFIIFPSFGGYIFWLGSQHNNESLKKIGLKLIPVGMILSIICMVIRIFLKLT